MRNDRRNEVDFALLAQQDPGAAAAFAEEDAEWWPCRVCFVGTLVLAVVVSVGLFEMVRISSHILKSPCRVVDYEVYERGACTVCTEEPAAAPEESSAKAAQAAVTPDSGSWFISDASAPKESVCTSYPMGALRLTVNFRPAGWEKNATASVWHCKELVGLPSRNDAAVVGEGSNDPCRLAERLRHPRLHIAPLPYEVLPRGELDYAGEVSGSTPLLEHCQLTTALQLAEAHTVDPWHECFYNSWDPEHQPVFFSMPGQGSLDRLWLGKVKGYPLACVFCGMILISLVLGAVALLADDRDMGGSGRGGYYFMD